MRVSGERVRAEIRGMQSPWSSNVPEEHTGRVQVSPTEGVGKAQDGGVRHLGWLLGTAELKRAQGILGFWLLLSLPPAPLSPCMVIWLGGSGYCWLFRQ